MHTSADKLNLILDTDLNFPSDDFQSLILIAASQKINLLGVCATAGNTWSEEVYFNIRKALTLIGLNDTPVLVGLPFSQIKINRDWALCQKKRGIVPFIGAFEKSITPQISNSERKFLLNQNESAGQFIANRVMNSSGPVRLLCIGPLTNIQNAIQIAPEIITRIECAYVMGGFFKNRMVYPHRADFNFWFDPYSADFVMNAGIPIMLISLDVCRLAPSNLKLIENLAKCKGRLSDIFYKDYLGMVSQHSPRMSLGDLLSTLVMLNPHLISETNTGNVSVKYTFDDKHGISTFEESRKGTVTLIRSLYVQESYDALVKYFL